jgi:hypothetical protein
MFKILSLFLFLVFAATVQSAVFTSSAKTATDLEAKKIQAAAKKVHETISSQCFSDWMIRQKMNETGGRTPAEVVSHIRSLDDVVPVKIYFRCTKRGFRCPVPTSAVAYRQPPEKAINMNRAAFTLRTSDCRWAATMAHEALGHSLGNYGHSMEWTRQREDTVPYLLSGRKPKFGGDVFKACCKE